MRSDIHKKIELATNIAIIVVAVLSCVVLVKNYLISKSISTTGSVAIENQNQIGVGTKLSLPGVDWRENGRTLLLVLSTTCHFCSDSAPFYQQLLKERGSNIRIIAVLPQSISASKEYLNRLGVTVDDIRQSKVSSLGVRGTPTLILVDNNGVVMNSWVGKLPSTKEAQVIDQIQERIARK